MNGDWVHQSCDFSSVFNFLGHRNKINYHNHCFLCSKPDCWDKKMPEMEIERIGRHNKRFKISPTAHLQKHYHDWPDRIKVELKGLKKGIDYKTVMVVVSKLKSQLNQSNLTIKRE